ncbi:hypothetical protein GAYE_SCF38G5262 [Galdieria yellowstonensis]|uniref:Uncharacterized protein n=1 Tax=Galdieria yellowstonensis TaxID=3028027 RepID=A0AAV9IIS6_9RHOD|nr:hypothetical protein GAYE_SCF38G5262 [Galdieria yellowstonensis]
MAIPLVVKAAATVHTSVGSCCIADNNFPKLASERTFRLSIFSPRTYKFAAYCRARLQLESLYKWKQACVKDILGSVGSIVLGYGILKIPWFQRSGKLRCLHWACVQQSKNILEGLGLSELEFQAFSALEKTNRLARQLVSFEMELITGN